ncbi:MAG: hypothetical protein AAGG80_05800 [Pseudomonadota bacterium]
MIKKIAIPLFIFLTLTACVTQPPNNINNMCSVFMQYPHWYWTTQRTQRRWGVPISVQMAIIYQESRFRAYARPPREHLLWIIPWFRPTSADGYAQAINETWRRYKAETGHHFAKRDNFKDADDFIGWFAYRAHRQLGISRANAFRLYLAYHEGIQGYRWGTYRRKRWLIDVAKRVQRKAWTYDWQLRRCRSELPTKPWYHFW